MCSAIPRVEPYLLAYTTSINMVLSPPVQRSARGGTCPEAKEPRGLRSCGLRRRAGGDSHQAWCDSQTRTSGSRRSAGSYGLRRGGLPDADGEAEHLRDSPGRGTGGWCASGASRGRVPTCRGVHRCAWLMSPLGVSIGNVCGTCSGVWSGGEFERGGCPPWSSARLTISSVAAGSVESRGLSGGGLAGQRVAVTSYTLVWVVAVNGWTTWTVMLSMLSAVRRSLIR